MHALREDKMRRGASPADSARDEDLGHGKGRLPHSVSRAACCMGDVREMTNLVTLRVNFRLFRKL